MYQGVEAGLDAALPLLALAAGDSLTVTAAYTYSDFFFEGDARNGDNELPGVPRHHLRAEARYRHPSGVYAGLNVEWAPSRYFADNANRLTVDPSALLGVKLGYDAGRRWSTYIEGRNMTDKHYISAVSIAGAASPTSEIFDPRIGRAVFGGVRGRW